MTTLQLFSSGIFTFNSQTGSGRAERMKITMKIFRSRKDLSKCTVRGLIICKLRIGLGNDRQQLKTPPQKVKCTVLV